MWLNAGKSFPAGQQSRRKNIMNDLQFILDTAAEKRPVIDRMTQTIWDYAEPDYGEYQSCDYLVSVLEQEGFTVEKGAGGIPTAFAARYGHGHPVIGITAEYDSLPGLSQERGNPVRSPLPGHTHGHGCGHNALGSGAVGAAILVRHWLEESGTEGTIVCYGTPAEENGFGKTFMLKAGCFRELDACFTWHPRPYNASPAYCHVGYLVAKFTFSGVSAHAAASPEKGRSALDACELMNVGVNYLREHVIDKARMHYAYLDAGGQAPNVVQSHTVLLYYLRAPKIAYSKYLLERVSDIARGAALMTGTQVQIEQVGGMSDYIPNPVMCQTLSDAYLATGAPDFDEEDYAVARRFVAALSPEQQDEVLRTGAAANGVSTEEFAEKPLVTSIIPFDPAQQNTIMTGSTDFGDVSYAVPCAQLNATTCIPGTSMHTWQHTAMVGTSIGNKAAFAAAKGIAYGCVKVFRQPELCAEARKQLLAVTHGEYESPIPDGILPGEGITL